MSLVLWVAVVAVIGVISFIIWDKYRNKSDIEEIIVSYSELVGDRVVEHKQQYKGILNKKEDIFKIPSFNLNLPLPPSESLISTNIGTKKVYVIRLDSHRYGYRIPSLHNEMFIQERDMYGKPMFDKGKPILKKHKWKYCDDVVEPDVKHWDENITQKLIFKHRTRNDMLQKWIMPIMMGLILVAAIIGMHFTTKHAGNLFDKVATISGETSKEVKESSTMLGNIIKRLDDKETKTNANSDSGG
jgi:hypothetical protein